MPLKSFNYMSNKHINACVPKTVRKLEQLLWANVLGLQDFNTLFVGDKDRPLPPLQTICFVEWTKESPWII